jgi:hypothetical protein
LIEGISDGDEDEEEDEEWAGYRHNRRGYEGDDELIEGTSDGDDDSFAIWPLINIVTQKESTPLRAQKVFNQKVENRKDKKPSQR